MNKSTTELLLKHQPTIIFQFGDIVETTTASGVCFLSRRCVVGLSNGHQFQFGSHFAADLQLADTSGWFVVAVRVAALNGTQLSAFHVLVNSNGWRLPSGIFTLVIFTFRVLFHLERIPLDSFIVWPALLRLTQNIPNDLFIIDHDHYQLSTRHQIPIPFSSASAF